MGISFVSGEPAQRDAWLNLCQFLLALKKGYCRRGILESWGKLSVRKTSWHEKKCSAFQ